MFPAWFLQMTIYSTPYHVHQTKCWSIRLYALLIINNSTFTQNPMTLLNVSTQMWRIPYRLVLSLRVQREGERTNLYTFVFTLSYVIPCLHPPSAASQPAVNLKPTGQSDEDLDDTDDGLPETLSGDELTDKRYMGSNIPSRSFKMLQMSIGKSEEGTEPMVPKPKQNGMNGKCMIITTNW